MCILDPLSVTLCSINILIPVEDLFTGHQVSDCLQPCLRTSASVVEGEILDSNYAVFYLHFSPTVELKKMTREKMNIFDVFVVLGSHLALWPGLGVYNILEWILTIFVGTTVCSKLCCFSCSRAEQTVEAEQENISSNKMK